MTNKSEAVLSFRGELYRKGLHLLALVLPVAAWYLPLPVSQIGFTSIAGVAVLADILRARSVLFSRFIRWAFAFMMRPTELPPVPGKVVLNGATYVVISLSLLIWVFPLSVAIPAFCMFMLGDAAAAIVGRTLGRTQWPGTNRTVEGTLAYCGMCAVVAGGLHLAGGPAPELIGLVAFIGVTSVLEAAPLPLNDNLVAPLGGAWVLSFFA